MSIQSRIVVHDSLFHKSARFLSHRPSATKGNKHPTHARPAVRAIPGHAPRVPRTARSVRPASVSPRAPSRQARTRVARRLRRRGARTARARKPLRRLEKGASASSRVTSRARPRLPTASSLGDRRARVPDRAEMGKGAQFEDRASRGGAVASTSQHGMSPPGRSPTPRSRGRTPRDLNSAASMARTT
jgi:hypothetical protein